MNRVIERLVQYKKFLAVLVLSVTAAVLVAFLLIDESESNKKVNQVANNNQSNVQDDELQDDDEQEDEVQEGEAQEDEAQEDEAQDNQDAQNNVEEQQKPQQQEQEQQDTPVQKEEDKKEEDNIEPVEIGFEFGNTKYESGKDFAEYDEDGVIIYESVREEKENLFFTTSAGEYDTISQYHSLLWEWEGDGGIFVNGYREDVPLIKYNQKAYYIYFVFDGVVKNFEVGTRVSIQGTLLDGAGGKSKLLPVTYEYRGGTEWAIISREAIVPQEKPPQHEDITVTEWNSERPDIVPFFKVTDNCAIQSWNTLLFSWTEGGVYIDGVKKNVPLLKFSATDYYVYLHFDAFASVPRPKEGTLVSLQGTLTDGKNTSTFAPVTFRYNGDSEWEIVSRDPITPKEEEAGAVVKVTVDWDDTRQDKNLFLLSDKEDAITKTNALLWDWSEGGIYVNGNRVSVPMVKYAATGYYVYFAFDQCTTVNPIEGTRVGIEGILSDGTNQVEFLPATFEFDGEGNWTLISRDSVIPEETGSTITWDITRKDKNFFFTTDKTDTVALMNELIWSWADGGIYIDGQPVSIPVIKHAGTGYHVYFGFDNYATVNPVAGTKLTIDGVLLDKTNQVRFLPVTYEFDGTDTWTLVSREPLPPAALDVEFEFQADTMASWGWYQDIMLDTDPDIEAIPGSTTFYPTWDGDDSGIFIDGVKTSVPLVKNAGVYYINLSFAPDPHPVYDEMVVTMKGSFTDYGVTINVAPMSFKYDADDTTATPNGTWTLLTEQPEVPEEPEVPKSTISWYDGHVSSREKNMFWFSITPGDELFFGGAGTVYWSSWADFRLTPKNGTMQGLNQQLIKWSSDQYYLILPAAQEAGAILQIQGTLTDEYIGGGGHTVTFAPATFELQEDGSWELIATEPF